MTESPADLALRLELARARAMQDNDSDALAQLLASDLVYVHSSGGADTQASYLSQLTQGALRYRTVTLDDIKLVRQLPDALVITGRMSAQVERSGRQIDVRSVYMAVWAQEAAGWRLLAFQGTGVAPAKP